MNAASESVVFSIDIKANYLQLAALEKELKQTRDSMKALTKANGEGKLSNEELADATVRYKAEASEISTQIKRLTDANKQQIAVNKAAASSVDQLKAKAALLTTAYNSLSESERKNTVAGRALTAELLETNDALKEAGAKVGDFRRGVGQYKDAIVAAAKESGLFGGVTERLSDAQSKYAAAQKIAAIVTGATTGATKALRVAFLAIPLFAVIALLGTMYAALTKTQQGMDFVERKTAAVGAVFNVLLKVVTDVGGKLVAAATDPKKAFSDLGDFLQNNIANRFRALGVLLDAIRNNDLGKLRDGVIQLTTGVSNGTAKTKAFTAELTGAAAAQERLTAETQRIRAAERELGVQREESRAKIEALKKLSDDAVKSVAVRTDAAKQAARIENRLLATQLNLQGDKIKNLQAEQKLKGNITNEDRQALADLRKERASTIQESETLQTELQNKINSLATEAAALAAKRRQDVVKAEQTAVALRLLEVEKGGAAELVLRQKQVDLVAKLALATEQQTANERKLILANAELEKQKLQEEFNAKQIEQAKAHTDAITAERKREYEEAKRLLEDYLDRARAVVELQLASGVISAEEAERKINAINQAGYRAALVNAEDYGQEKGAILKAQADEEIRESIRVKNEKGRIEQAKEAIIDSALRAGIDASDAIIEALGAETEAGKAAIVIKKTLSIIEVGLALQRELAANAEAGAKIGAIAPPATTPLGIAYTIATDLASLAAAAGRLNEIAGFATGGRVYGEGTETSDSIPARLSHNEHVLSAAEVRGMGGHSNVEALRSAARQGQLPPVLSWLSGPTSSPGFALGGAIGRLGNPVVADGGLMARQLGGQVVVLDPEMLVRALENGNYPVSFESFNRSKAKYDKPRALSTLGKRN